MTIKYTLVGTLETQLNDFEGLPVIGGYLYTYKATAHAEKKPIAKIQDPILPQDFYENPINLDSSGSIPDPYVTFFAEDVLYYVVLTTSDQDPLQPPDVGNILRTWDNFGPDQDITPKVEEIDFTNYILNATFRFSRKNSYDSTDLVSGSYHLVANTGWYFFRDNDTATISLTFVEFDPGQSDVPNNPFKYARMVKTAGSGEIHDDFVFRTDDVTAFNGETIQYAFWAKSPTNSVIELITRQVFGSGGSAVVQTAVVIQLTDTWAKYHQELAITSISGKTIGPGNYFQIGIKYPLNEAATVDYTQEQLNRGEHLLEYDYKTKEIDQESQRTYQLPFALSEDIFLPIWWDGEKYVFDNSEVGTVVVSFEVSKKGYLLADGSEYFAYSDIAETKDLLQYTRLFDKWNSYISTLLPIPYFSHNGNAFGYGTSGFMPSAIYSAVTTFFNPTKYATVTNWADTGSSGVTFSLLSGGETNINANLPIEFKRSSSLFPLGYPAQYNELEIENKVDGAVTAVNVGTMGAALTVSQLVAGGVSAKEKTLLVFSITAGTITTLQGKHWTFDTPAGAYYAWYKVDGVGTDPAVPAHTGLLVELATSYMSSGQFSYVTYGVLSGFPQTSVTFPAGSTISGGDYFEIYNVTDTFGFYYVVDGVGIEPTITGALKVLPIAIEASYTAADVRYASIRVMKSLYFQVPDMRALGIRGSDHLRGLSPEEVLRYMRGDFARGSAPGTVQLDEFLEHEHEILDINVFSSPKGTSLNEPYLFDQPATRNTEETGGKETRMMNISVNYFIKY